MPSRYALEHKKDQKQHTSKISDEKINPSPSKKELAGITFFLGILALLYYFVYKVAF